MTYLMSLRANWWLQSPVGPALTRSEIATCSGSVGAVPPTSGLALPTIGTEKKVGAGDATTRFWFWMKSKLMYSCQGRKRVRPGWESEDKARSAAYQPAGYSEGLISPCIPKSRPLP